MRIFVLTAKKAAFVLIILCLSAGVIADEVLTITADNNVGINNSSPQEALDVTGNVLVSEVVSSKNLIYDEVIVIKTTIPPYAGNNSGYVELPAGFTAENTFIITAKCYVANKNHWGMVPLAHHINGYVALSIEDTSSCRVVITNAWSSDSFDNAEFFIVIGRIDVDEVSMTPLTIIIQ